MGKRRLLAVIALLMASTATWADSGATQSTIFTSVKSHCADCEIRLGVGGTYHFWGSTSGVVVPLTLSWKRGRYEFGVFRFASDQNLKDPVERTGKTGVDPYWGASLSRRWQLIERGPFTAIAGFGLSYKSQLDTLSATHFNFASQLGLRLKLPYAHSTLEFSMRHWSNAGIKLPNHGQDFATLMIRVDVT